MFFKIFGLLNFVIVEEICFDLLNLLILVIGGCFKEYFFELLVDMDFL